MHPANLIADVDRVVNVIYVRDGKVRQVNVIPHSIIFKMPQSRGWIVQGTDFESNTVIEIRMNEIIRWVPQLY